MEFKILLAIFAHGMAIFCLASKAPYSLKKIITDQYPNIVASKWTNVPAELSLRPTAHAIYVISGVLFDCLGYDANCIDDRIDKVYSRASQGLASSLNSILSINFRGKSIRQLVSCRIWESENFFPIEIHVILLVLRVRIAASNFSAAKRFGQYLSALNSAAFLDPESCLRKRQMISINFQTFCAFTFKKNTDLVELKRRYTKAIFELKNVDSSTATNVRRTIKRKLDKEFRLLTKEENLSTLIFVHFHVFMIPGMSQILSEELDIILSAAQHTLSKSHYNKISLAMTLMPLECAEKLSRHFSIPIVAPYEIPCQSPNLVVKTFFAPDSVANQLLINEYDCLIYIRCHTLRQPSVVVYSATGDIQVLSPGYYIRLNSGDRIFTGYSSLRCIRRLPLSRDLWKFFLLENRCGLFEVFSANLIH